MRVCEHPNRAVRTGVQQDKDKDKDKDNGNGKDKDIPVGELIGEIRSSQNRSGTRQEDSQLGVRTNQTG